jgi:hypothetical protein
MTVQTALCAEKSSKNFRTAGITCHTRWMCTPVWTTWDQTSNDPARVSQPRPFPQRLNNDTTLIHRYPTAPHRRHPAQTPLHPQSPQALLLLLIYLPRKFFEEGRWGTHQNLPDEPLRPTRCQGDRLAFKLGLKALRCSATAVTVVTTHRSSDVLRHQETAA